MKPKTSALEVWKLCNVLNVKIYSLNTHKRKKKCPQNPLCISIVKTTKNSLQRQLRDFEAAVKSSKFLWIPVKKLIHRNKKNLAVYKRPFTLKNNKACLSAEESVHTYVEISPHKCRFRQAKKERFAHIFSALESKKKYEDSWKNHTGTRGRRTTVNPSTEKKIPSQKGFSQLAAKSRWQRRW